MQIAHEILPSSCHLYLKNSQKLPWLKAMSSS